LNEPADLTPFYGSIVRALFSAVQPYSAAKGEALLLKFVANTNLFVW
jgi:hypothetical protein